MLTGDETPQALLEEPASQAKQKADGPGGGGALTDPRAKPMRCWGRSCRRQGAASLLTALSSSRETPWSPRQISQGEADALHSGRADPCDFPKCGRLHWASPVAQVVKNLPAVQETWIRSLGWEDPLEEEMATHSSIFAWRIPWTEEPGGLQSMRSQRVGHD